MRLGNRQLYGKRDCQGASHAKGGRLSFRPVAGFCSAVDSPKKAAALKHYQAAEKAHEAENDEEAHKELKEASRALM